MSRLEQQRVNTGRGNLVDRLSDALGNLCGVLTLVMVLVTVLIVVLRYAFGIGTIALQESVIYMHGAVFLLGIPYALRHDAHVRVDLLYTSYSERRKAWLNLMGHVVFLLPVAGFLLASSWPYAAASWRVLETSSEVGGIPAVFVLKSLIPLGATLLVLQGLSEIVRLSRQLGLFATAAPTER